MADFFDASGEGASEERPRGVYAILAESESDGDGGVVRQFECIEADHFDAAERGRAVGPNYWSRAPISVVEYHAFAGDLSLLATAEDNQVLHLKLNDEGRGDLVEQYLSLFGAAIKRYAEVEKGDKKILIAPPEDAFPSASEADLVAALETGDGRGDYAAAYDVGQGNCNALLDANLFPRLYYDVGGGVMGNAPSYPQGLLSFCMTKKPTIVLSHWDWDHWSSAMRTRGAPLGDFVHGSVWIVPRQAIGPVHAAFLARLNATATVLFWPDNLPSIKTRRGIELAKCKGPPRNDSGLVMRTPMSWTRGAGVLMVGDCSYRHLPPAFAQPIDALIVTHHGGLSEGGAPPAPAIGGARWVLSCGSPNRHGHPRHHVLGEHETCGWTNAAMRDTRNRQNGMGHVLIGDPSQQAPGVLAPPCSARGCQLTITQ